MTLMCAAPQFADSWLPVIDEVASAGFRAVAVNQRGSSSGARPFDRDNTTWTGTWEDSRMRWGFAEFHSGVYMGLCFKVPQRIRSLTSLCTPPPERVVARYAE